VHPKSVTLFIETDADDLPAQEQHKQRHARSARRSRSARAVRVCLIDAVRQGMRRTLDTAGAATKA
jgi:hypothetical protein